MENQVGRIDSTLSCRTLGALISSLVAKVIEMCKVIKLRNGKECEGPTQMREDPPRENLTIHVTSGGEESEPTETTPFEEPIKENVKKDQGTLKTFGMPSAP